MKVSVDDLVINADNNSISNYSFEDLVSFLKEMYSNPKETGKAAAIHMFSIKYAASIIKNCYSPKKLLSAAGMDESYSVEINKGLNIYRSIEGNEYGLSFDVIEDGFSKCWNLLINDVKNNDNQLIIYLERSTHTLVWEKERFVDKAYGKVSGKGKQYIYEKDVRNVFYDKFERIENSGSNAVKYNDCKAIINILIDKYGLNISDSDRFNETDIFKHNLYGVHITEKNNALSNENPHICIGWSILGDLTEVIQKEALYELYKNNFPNKSPYAVGKHVNQIWRFKNEAQVGDYVILAEPTVIHIGRITSDYYFDNTDNSEQYYDYKSTRTIEWLKTNIKRSTLSNALHSCLGRRSPFFPMNDFKSAIAELLQDKYVSDDEEYEEASLVFETGIKKDTARNRIYFGAPGTGKSYSINDSVQELLNDDENTNKKDNYIRVTFHQDYSYAQFVGAYKPTMNGNAIEYKYVPGPFMRVLAMAYKNILNNTDSNGSVDPESIEPFVLVIEEINRAKTAAVFGDMFQLLDRDDNGASVYDMQPSQEIKDWLAEECGVSADTFNSIRIPDNMFIWASMNSADQGVFPMDTAMKRRWEFEYVGINDGEFIADENGNKRESQGGTFTVAEKEIEWNVLRRAINAKLVSNDIKVHEDKLMGPFFIKTMDKNGDKKFEDDQFITLFCEKVLMYLFEDAAKTKRSQLFNGISDKINQYSHICDEFKAKGMLIFGENFEADYYNMEKAERDTKIKS